MNHDPELNRLTRDEMFMSIAHLISNRGTCPRRHVGAVLVRRNKVISIGYNGAPAGDPHCITEGCIIDSLNEGCARAVHAETNAILYGSISLSDEKALTLYITDGTCRDCADQVIKVKAFIKEVVYDREYRDPSGLQRLRKAEISIRQFTTPFDITFTRPAESIGA